MHKLKAIILAFAIAMASLLLVTPTYASMGTACSDAGFDDPLLCGTANQNEEAVIQQKVANVLNQVYLWIGIIAVVVIVISGIRYMTSQGNAESVKKAKSGIMYASIGLVVVLAAFAITLVITNAVQGNQVNGGGAGGGGGGGGGGSPTDTIEVEYITISPTNIKLEVGETAKIAAYVVPDYATNHTVTFESSKTSVATVDSTSGLVTAKGEGTATITAKSNNGKTATATVEVTKVVEAESVEITSTITEITVGKTATLTAKVLPENTKDKTLTWSSNKTDILKVTNSSTGAIKGIKAGEATVTVKTTNNKKATVKITVKDATSNKVKKLQDTVKTYAWPKYRGSDRTQVPAYTSAYNAAASSFVSNHDCKGDDCGVFVLITMRNSGWEPNYPDQRTGGQYTWLNNPANGWEDVTNKIKSNADAKPGDVIITRGQGHVLMFVGKIDGFESQMASASYCHRSPMADGSTNIMSYVNGKHSNGKSYAVFRKKNQ